MFFSLHKAFLGVGFTMAVLFSANSLASIVINGTRVIYPSDQKEVSVKLNNMGHSPVLVQSWLDTGAPNAKPSEIKVPFILTPPMNRVEGGKGQTLRMSYLGDSLPKDKESVFWLNVLEVPAKKQEKSAENYLQMAFRSRIKVFYRPVGLEGNANDAAKAVTWSVKDNSLQAFNPTPYYVSFVSLTVNGKKIEGEMVAPRSTLVFALSANKANIVNGEFVNDYGAINSFNAEIH